MKYDMQYRLFEFTNPVILIILFIFFEIVYKIITLIQHTVWKSYIKWRSLIYVILIVFSITVYYEILFTKDYQKSLVDSTPISKLSDEQINNIENNLKLFNEYDFISKCNIVDTIDHRELNKYCDIIMYRKDTLNSLNITLMFYKNEKMAIETFQLLMDGKYTHIINGNNTEALLFDSYMHRSHNVPDTYRYLHSIIRLNNIIIYLSENPKPYMLANNISSDFILLLCEILT
jgi:hypothetical protein